MWRSCLTFHLPRNMVEFNLCFGIFTGDFKNLSTEDKEIPNTAGSRG